MTTDLNTLIPLYLFACWHVLMPGHGKTLLVAVCLSGNARSRLLPLALGYGLSHGLLMALAALAGLLLTQRLALWVNQYGLWIKNLYLPLLLAFGVLFALKARRISRKSNRPDDERTAPKFTHGGPPFLAGLGIGLIPCSDVLGLAVISPMLVKTGHNRHSRPHRLSRGARRKSAWPFTSRTSTGCASGRTTRPRSSWPKPTGRCG